tara:strand:+ start:2249 stop:2653 length:405 start_codon:yes stop_codon:yes gene_type:complete
MIKSKVVASLFGIVFAFASAADVEIADRIKKVGEVCIEGQDCGSAPIVLASVESVGVEENYNKSCATCHIAGVAGAPKLGDGPAWEPRVAKGMETLYNSVINGLPPAMPAKGMCFSCSDDDLRDLVDYMVDSVR